MLKKEMHEQEIRETIQQYLEAIGSKEAKRLTNPVWKLALEDISEGARYDILNAVYRSPGNRENIEKQLRFRAWDEIEWKIPQKMDAVFATLLKGVKERRGKDLKELDPEGLVLEKYKEENIRLHIDCEAIVDALVNYGPIEMTRKEFNEKYFIVIIVTAEQGGALSEDDWDDPIEYGSIDNILETQQFHIFNARTKEEVLVVETENDHTVMEAIQENMRITFTD